MKILLVADNEESALWGKWSEDMAAKIADVDLVLSAGDLSAYYLEHLADNINAPVVFVPGNHDSGYIQRPPKRCINTDGRITEISITGDSETNHIRICGIGGSMQYKDGPYQYTEEEQAFRVRKLMRDIKSIRANGNHCMDIVLTHAPCRDYGDMQDVPHRGFECFNEFLYELKPKLHCYGHIHEEYYSISPTAREVGFQRVIKHPSGTNLINGSGFCFIIV